MSLYVKKRKRVLKKVLIGFSLFFVGSTAYVLFSSLTSRFFPYPFMGNPVFAVLITTLAALLTYKPLDYLMTQLFKNYLFRKKSYSHMALMDLAEELATILDLTELANLVVNTFGETLHLKTVALVIPSRIRDDYEIISAYGWNVSDCKRVRLPKDSPLLRMIQDGGPHVLVRDRALRTLDWQEANRLAHDFDSLRASWVIPFFAREEFVGVLTFSSYIPESIFDEGDFHFFREFAQEVAKCVRNALSVQELKLANQELQDVQSQLLQSIKIQAIEQLATGIAHEIHNPLTIISGKAQVLLLQKDRASYDERVEEVLKTIVKQTKRAADITKKLLMFSQSSGSPKEMLDLSQVLEDTIALVSYQTSLEGIEVTRSVAGALPPYYANVHEFREVFLNLILNAVQSIGSKGKIHCEIRYRCQDEILEISVSDTGKGIDPQNRDKVFNPFFTTRTNAVGLGLFVTKQIVHRYAGSIRVESRVGEGSLFIVQLPLMESSKRVPAEKSLPLPFLKQVESEASS
ncbi:MAG: GAF domain-containing protein [Candidatus Omnitrophica bacterium]|nr:GAF domain-containing protein [Candidatus Omnitrophota bacterium]